MFIDHWRSREGKINLYHETSVFKNILTTFDLVISNDNKLQFIKKRHSFELQEVGGTGN